jgi:murein DD-endopeptidase MepM/ murein hydrolase activator NlpD
MQLMWLSSPLGKMHAISITKRRVLLGIAALAATFMLIGMLLYFFGFRMAVQFRPDLVRAVGGVMTAGDMEQHDAEHRARLAQLQQQLVAAEQQLRELKALKDSFMELALPKGQRAPAPVREKKRPLGMGGPQRSVFFGESHEPTDIVAGSMDDRFDTAQEQFARLNEALTQLQSDWQHELSWLEYLPTGLPVGGPVSISSHFGGRPDPFTHSAARHEGVDFSAPSGTPILAAASGVVVRVAHDTDYGRMVEIDHGNGYMTRYAHASAIYVKEGDRVTRGMRIGAVGSTGRSTGPHLHFEVYKSGTLLNPERLLAHLE